MNIKKGEIRPVRTVISLMKFVLILVVSIGSCFMFFTFEKDIKSRHIENDDYKATLLTHYKNFLGSPRVKHRELVLKPKLTGVYTVNVWSLKHRGSDRLEKSVSTAVNELPFEEKIIIDSMYSRVEVIYSKFPLSISNIDTQLF